MCASPAIGVQVTPEREDAGGSVRQVAADVAESSQPSAMRAGKVTEVRARRLLVGSGSSATDVWTARLSNSVVVHAATLPAGASQRTTLRVLVQSKAGDTGLSAPTLRSKAIAAMVNDALSNGAPAARLLEAQGWSAQARAWNRHVVLSADGPEDGLDEACRILTEVVRSPAWSQAGLTRWRERTRAAMAASGSDVRDVLNLVLERVAGMPVSQPADLEAEVFHDVAQAEQAAREFIQQNSISVSVAGGIERVKMLDAAAATFGGLGLQQMAGVRFPVADADQHALGRAQLEERWPRPQSQPPADIPPKEVRRLVRTKIGERALVLRGMIGEASSDLEAGRALRQAGQIYAQRAGEALKEAGLQQADGSLDLSAGMIFGDRHTGRALAWIVVAVEPERAEEALAVLDQSLAELANGGVSPEVAQAVRERTARAIARLVTSPAYWAERLVVGDATTLPNHSAHTLIKENKANEKQDIKKAKEK